MAATPPHFSLTRKGAGLVFVSGQLAFADGGGSIRGDVAAQTLVCLTRIEKALKFEGLGPEAIRRCGCWLADAQDYPEFNEAYARFFGTLPPPARTTLVAGFCVAGALVEIDAIAAHPDYVNARTWAALSEETAR